MEGNNISVIDEDVEAVLLRERVKLVLEVFTVLNVLLKAEDSPFLEVDGLANNLSKDVGVVESLTCWLESTLGLRLGTGEHENAGSLKDFSLDLIRLEVDLKLPLFHLLRVGDHAI